MHENGIDRNTVMKMTGLSENDLAQTRRSQKSELPGGKLPWDMIIKTRTQNHTEYDIYQFTFKSY